MNTTHQETSNGVSSSNGFGTPWNPSKAELKSLTTTTETPFVGEDDSFWGACTWLHNLGVGGQVDRAKAEQILMAGRSLFVWAYIEEVQKASVRWVLANVENLAIRWKNKNPTKAEDTPHNYMTKVKNLCEAYISRCKDPMGFSPEKHFAAGRRLHPGKATGTEDSTIMPRKPRTTITTTAPAPEVSVQGSLAITLTGAAEGAALLKLPVEAKELTIEHVAQIISALAPHIRQSFRWAELPMGRGGGGVRACYFHYPMLLYRAHMGLLRRGGAGGQGAPSPIQASTLKLSSKRSFISPSVT